MDPQSALGTNDLITHLIGDMAQAVAERPGESPTRRLERAQAAAQTILTFQPADAIEAMIAGHCMMLHELIVDSVLETLRGEPDSKRRTTPGGIVAMHRAFGANLTCLERYRTRHAGTAAEIQPADDRVETVIAGLVARLQSCPAAATAGAAQSAWAGDPVPEANGAAAAGAAPSAAAALAGFNRQARRQIRRQANKAIAVHSRLGRPLAAGGEAAAINDALAGRLLAANAR